MSGSATLPAAGGFLDRCKHTRLPITAPHLLQIVVGASIRVAFPKQCLDSQCKAASSAAPILGSKMARKPSLLQLSELDAMWAPMDE
jgi:hypothetical protein